MLNNKTNRIVINTMFLYFRQILTMLVSLYTSRVVLEVLGISDFGIYNVVAGIILSFNFLQGILSNSTQRFLSFAIGKKDYSIVNKTFSAAIFNHWILAIIGFFLIEIIGYWLLNTKMNIPIDRKDAANIVFHCSALTFVVSMVSIPFNALIVSFEKMKAFAYISFVEVLFKLFLVVSLSYLESDRLKLYSVFLLAVSLLIRMIYWYYCRKNFTSVKFDFKIDRKLMKEMFSFSSWTLLGNSAIMGRDYGTNILLNIFFGPTVNAARGIAFQVNTSVNSFVANFQVALSPQIVKSYSTNDNEYFQKLINKGAKLSYILLLLMVLPIFLKTEYILSVWLVNVPDRTILFVRLILLISLVDSICRTLVTAHLATGKIKLFQIVIGGVNLMILPISYLLLKLGYGPEVTMLTAIIITMISVFIRPILLSKVVNFNVKSYYNDVVFNVIKVTIYSCILPVLILKLIEENNLISFIIVSFSSIVSVLIFSYYFGMDGEDRAFIKKYINKIKRKVV